jgi:hypothetical protein
VPDLFLTIAPPLGGLAEADPYSKQELGTSSDMVNHWPIDPATGRSRFSVRPGATLFQDQINGSNKVSRLIDITYHNAAQTTWTAISSGAAADWSLRMNAGQPVYACATDAQGNLFVVDGRNSVVKYNSKGVEVARFSPPIQDEAGQVRALAVDDSGAVFFGTTLGGYARKSRLYCFAEGDENKYALRWSISRPDDQETVTKIYGFVAKIVAKDGFLYTIQSDDVSQRSYGVIYSGLLSAEPDVDRQFELPYPARGLAVSKSGEMYVTWPAFADRYIDPRAPECFKNPYDRKNEPGHKGLWTWEDLVGYESRVWFQLDMDNLDQNDNLTLEDGDRVRLVNEVSGSGRDLRAGETTAATFFDGPRFLARGMAFRPSLYFEGQRVTGSSSTAPVNRLRSQGNGTYAYAARKQERTILPAWDDTTGAGAGFGAHYVLCVLCKPAQEAARGLFLYMRMNGTSGSDNIKIGFNSSDFDGTPTDNAGQFVVKMEDSTGTIVQRTGSYDNQAQASLITVTYNWDNAADTTVRHLGTQVGAAFQARAGHNLQLVDIGYSVDADSSGPLFHAFKGELCEMVVFSVDVAADTASLNEAPPLTSDERERVEAYMAWKRGIPNLLGGGHAYNFAAAPPLRASNAASTAHWRAILVATQAGVGKWSANGELVWAYDTATIGNGGVGYDVVALSNGDIVSCGPTETDDVAIRRITDNGSTATFSGGSTWTKTLGVGLDWGYEYPRMSVDAEDNVYVPVYVSSAHTESARVYDETGTLLSTVDGLTGDPQAHAVAHGTTPIYWGDVADKRAEYMFLVTAQDTPAATDLTVYRVPLVSKAVNSAELPRITTHLAVSGGLIKKYDGTTVSDPTGGPHSLSATAKYIGAVAELGKVWFADGVTYKVYNPLEENGTESVTEWKSGSAGEMPAGCSLLASYRRRAVLAGDPSAPQVLYMSAVDDFEDWNYFPSIQKSTQAVFLSMGEPITALIPGGDDYFFVGLDRSIKLIRGDPMAGGEVDLLSDQTGIAWGDAWCKSPDGAIFAFGRRGGVYAIGINGVQSITDRFIQRRLESVDQSVSRAIMAWDTEYDGLHLFFAPWEQASAPPEHYFWSRKFGRWYPYAFGSGSSGAGMTPTAVVVSDGDAQSDRRLLIGAQDGRIRYFDKSYGRDALDTLNTSNILSHALIGPIVPESEIGEVGVDRFEAVLGQSGSGCNWEIYVADSPDIPAYARASGELMPGRNHAMDARGRGSFIWLKLSSDDQYSVESLRVGMYRLGQRRRITS